MAYFYVYLLTTKNNTVLYTGVTNDFRKRTYQHKHKILDGFTRKFHADKLVYYEQTENAVSAIQREKQIKSWDRSKKVKLVTDFNQDWVDLFESL